ncbi:MAG: hypothetical protein ABF377_13125 [Akkermansiaceae bacterium]
MKALCLLLLTGVSLAQTPSEPPKDVPESVPVPTSHLDPIYRKGNDLGRVGDSPAGPYRRLVQRTIIPGESLPDYGSILTFDDQLVPQRSTDSGALEIAADLKALNTRCLFFANFPDNGIRQLNLILRSKNPEATAKKFLDIKKPIFMASVRQLLRIKNDTGYVCEVRNHTAFHQDMKRLKPGTSAFKVCLLGIRYIETCLDESYLLERQLTERPRYFRYPFLHSPSRSTAKKEVNTLFTELGLISIGETQDSKDVLNFSPDLAYASLEAAKKNKRYNPTRKEHDQTDAPIALFHTRSWSRIRSGVVKAIKVPKPVKEPAPKATPVEDDEKITKPEPTAPPLPPLPLPE